ncbi:phosphatidylethanolamine-binding protein [Bombardia bombarda]|uniref:Phosphatidylethanolamine-binding protein n=1 Tax=Bombardia bombarda TaxID=252184 RepID=A0AA39XPJ1_9PEZI|nr:phosphatidylethanolamine-binding protein [Bombardia bombarda]
MPKQAASVTKALADLASILASDAPHKTGSLRIHFPSTVVTEPGTRLTKAATATEPTSYSVSATALNNIALPNCDLSPVTSTTFTTSAADDDDTTAIPNISKYMIVALDLDAPFPSWPVLGPVLHGVQADLSLATSRIDPDDEFIQLDFGDESTRGSRSVVSYARPGPPPPSSPHRYVFLLWEQPKELTTAKMREVLGFVEGQEIGVLGRARWDQEAFEKKLGLKNVVAQNYFVCC